MLKCKKCGAEATQKDLDYVEENDYYPSELEHQVDCGCYEEDEGLGETLCNCEFEKVSEIAILTGNLEERK